MPTVHLTPQTCLDQMICCQAHPSAVAADVWQTLATSPIPPDMVLSSNELVFGSGWKCSSWSRRSGCPCPSI